MNENANILHVHPTCSIAVGKCLASVFVEQQVVGRSLGLKGWMADSASAKHNLQPTSHPSACHSSPHISEIDNVNTFTIMYSQQSKIGDLNCGSRCLILIYCTNNKHWYLQTLTTQHNSFTFHASCDLNAIML